MKKLFIFILFIMITFPAINQDTKENTNNDKDKTKFGDVFDKREDDSEFPDEYEINMYIEENKLEPLKKKEKIIWAYRTALENPFI